MERASGEGMTKPRRKPSAPPTGQEPTPEARRHGQYIKSAARGARQFVNVTENLPAKYHRLGMLTNLGLQACQRFEVDHVRVWGMIAGRDSCVQRVGGEVFETDTAAEAIVKAKRRLDEIQTKADPSGYSAMHQVVITQEPLGRVDRNERRWADFDRAIFAAIRVYGLG